MADAVLLESNSLLLLEDNSGLLLETTAGGVTTSFTYTIRDSFNATSTATVNVTIEDIIPAASAQDEGPLNVTSGNILFADVLANDSPEGVILDVLVVPNPTKGTAVIESGQIKYTPFAGRTGPDSVGYRIKNTANNTTDIATLNINILTPSSSPNRSGLPWVSGVTNATNLILTNDFGAWRGRLIDISVIYVGKALFGFPGTADQQWSKVIGDPKLTSSGLVKDYMDSGIGVVFVIPLLVQQEHGRFDLIVNGTRDAEHIGMANKIAGWYNNQLSSYPQLWICLGQEVTDNGFPWTYVGANATQYIAAHRQIANFYKTRIGTGGAGKAKPVKFVWNSLKRNASARTYWPGGVGQPNGVYDAITSDPYDNWFDASWFQSAQQFQDWLGIGSSIASGYNGMDGLRRFAVEMGVKWGIQEWGPTWDNHNGQHPCPTTTRNPNNPYYMDGMFDYFSKYAASMAYDIMFNNTIDGCPPIGGGPPVQKHTIFPRQAALGVASDRYKANWTP